MTLIAVYTDSETRNNTALSISVPNVEVGDTLVFKGAKEGAQAALGNPTTTGETWVKPTNGSAGTSSADSYAAIFTMVATSAGTKVVGATSANNQSHSGVVEHHRDAEAGTTAVSTNNGGSAPSLSITTTVDGSTVTWVSADWNAVAHGTITYRSSATQELVTGTAGSDYFAAFAYQAAATAGAQTVGMTAPTGQKPSMVALEIKPAGSPSTNVDLTGAVVGSTTGAPAGSAAVTSVVNVALTGAVVGSTTAAVNGTASLATNVTDAGAVVGSVGGAPAGSLALSSNVALGGQSVGSTTTALAGALSTSSSVNVTLTGEVAGSTTASPAGTVTPTSTSDDVTLTGAVTGSVTAALAGSLTISSVGDVTLVGQPVGSVTDAPDGTLTIVSVVDVNLTGQTVGTTSGALAGALHTGSNVDLIGLVATAQTQALAGLLELVSSSSVDLAGGTTGSITDAPDGSLTITSAGDATANPAARLTLDATPMLALDATPNLTLTMTRPEVTLDTKTVVVGDTAPLTGKAGTDLTGAGVEAHVKLKDGSALTLTTTVTDAATGAWSAVWPTGGVPDQGPGTSTREVELQVTYSDGSVQTLGPVPLRIQQQIA